MTEEQQKELAQIFEAMGNAKGNFVIGQVMGTQINYFGERQKKQAQTEPEEVGQDAAQEAPANPPEKPEDPAKAFVDRVKLIMKNAEKDNGKEKPIKARGNGGTYIYNVDGDGFCDVMDDLLLTHGGELAAYLAGTKAETATSIKYVAPFIGFILDTHCFTHKDMPKNAFQEALESVYGEGTSAVLKMSDKHPTEVAQKLFDVTLEIIKKHKQA